MYAHAHLQPYTHNRTYPYSKTAPTGNTIPLPAYVTFQTLLLPPVFFSPGKKKNTRTRKKKVSNKRPCASPDVALEFRILKRAGRQTDRRLGVYSIVGRFRIRGGIRGGGFGCSRVEGVRFVDRWMDLCVGLGWSGVWWVDGRRCVGGTRVNRGGLSVKFWDDVIHLNSYYTYSNKNPPRIIPARTPQNTQRSSPQHSPSHYASNRHRHPPHRDTPVASPSHLPKHSLYSMFPQPLRTRWRVGTVQYG